METSASFALFLECVEKNSKKVMPLASRLQLDKQLLQNLQFEKLLATQLTLY